MKSNARSAAKSPWFSPAVCVLIWSLQQITIFWPCWPTLINPLLLKPHSHPHLEKEKHVICEVHASRKSWQLRCPPMDRPAHRPNRWNRAKGLRCWKLRKRRIRKGRARGQSVRWNTRTQVHPQLKKVHPMLIPQTISWKHQRREKDWWIETLKQWRVKWTVLWENQSWRQ